MASKVDTITAHGKANRSTYMINLFGSVIPIIMFLLFASTQIQGLATETEVVDLITVHNVIGMHPKAQLAVGDVQRQLNNILSFQIEERIEKQLKIVCQNPNLRDAIEPTVRQLIRDYDSVANRPYVRPSCEQLGVS